jgi:hypothetical protein
VCVSVWIRERTDEAPFTWRSAQIKREVKESDSFGDRAAAEGKQTPSIRVRSNHLDDFDLLIGVIDPVINGEAFKDRHVYPSARVVSLNVVRVPFGGCLELAKPDKE